MKSKLISINELNDDKNLKVVKAKPTILLIILIVLSIFMIVFNKYLLFSISILIISLYSLIFFPKRILIKFRKDYMIIYDVIEKEYCHLVYYDEVLTWKYEKRRPNDLLYIELINGTILKSEAFNRKKILELMNYYVKEGNNERY